MTTPNLSLFHGPNAAYISELYEQYQQSPDSVDPQTRAYFEQWQCDPYNQSNGLPPQSNRFSPESPTSIGMAPAAADTPASQDAQSVQLIVRATRLVQAIREYGHLAAQLDPLGNLPLGDPALDLAYHQLTEADLHQMPASVVDGPVAERTETAWAAIEELRQIYSSTIGYDYDHLRDPEEREWLRQMAESCQFRPPNDPINPMALLQQLTEIESFEHFLHRTFVGKTRFSIEGLEMMVPILDEIIGDSAESGITSILIGMAHRGRLNVLAQVLQKPYSEILREFKDAVDRRSISARDHLGWTGDVKYHKGARRSLPIAGIMDLIVSIAPNPSHLEHVNPVVEGMARADGTYPEEPGAPRFNHHKSLPILIHGDAAFPGQGIVAETLNFSQLDGYFTGGTIHIIANNQLGFTTNPESSRSTLYASDLAKGFKIPIVHVNADDPVACIEAARLAAAYRNRFAKDFLIDLVGYRRYGHNEGDEPKFTQPKLYVKMESHPTIRQLWAEQLVADGELASGVAEQMVQAQMAHLQEIFDTLGSTEEDLKPHLTPPPVGVTHALDTSVSAELLQELNQSLQSFPDGFRVNTRLQRIFRRREDALNDPDANRIDWGHAEQLALASILMDDIPIRLTGEDVKRGTFSHRHAVCFDAYSGTPFAPLASIPQAQAAFEIHNSPLTENAALGFEYGYNIQKPGQLVIWEAQYGDFINGAQPIIDEFIVSGQAKWEQTPSLVMLLPHGYEGQGPDHSTARLERFLQMAADKNIRVANCTTAAQYFHLLRRQAILLKIDPLPLIIMAPKSLLRHPLAASSLRDISEGHWQPIIDDNDAKVQSEQVNRLILCSGKVYVDLISSEYRIASPWVAIARVEQLYPFFNEELETVLNGYPNLTEVVWLQEEPQNMGAWSHMQLYLEKSIDGRWPLRYIGRPRRANPAEGSSAWHAVNQAAIVEQAFDAIQEL